MADITSHVVPYEVIALAMHAPVQHPLWFALVFDGSMDGFIELVHPVAASRPRPETLDGTTVVRYSFEAFDAQGVRYVVNVTDAFPGITAEDFVPSMEVETVMPEPPKPRVRSS